MMIEEDSRKPSEDIDVSSFVQQLLKDSGSTEYPVLLGNATKEDCDTATELWRLRDQGKCAIRGEPLNITGNDLDMSHLSLQSDDEGFAMQDDPDMDISVEHSEFAKNLLSQVTEATQMSQLESIPNTGEVISSDAYEAMFAYFKDLCNTTDGDTELIAEAIDGLMKLNLQLMEKKATPPNQEATMVFPDENPTRNKNKKRKKAFYEI